MKIWSTSFITFYCLLVSLDDPKREAWMARLSNGKVYGDEFFFPVCVGDRRTRPLDCFGENKTRLLALGI